MLTILFLEF